MAENDNVSDTEDQDNLGNDQDPKVTDDNANVTAEDDDPVTAAIEAAAAAKLEALREQAREEARREYEERLEAERQLAIERENAEKLRTSFGSTVREVRENLKKVKLTDIDGNERTLSDDEIEQFVVQPFQRYNLTGEQAITYKTFSQLADAAMKALPESAKTEFVKRASNKPLEEWLAEFAELRAESTSFAKKLKADMDAAIKAAEARGVAKGQKMSPSPPSQGPDSSKPNNQAVDRSTLGGAAKALAQGLISESEYVEIHNKLSRF